MVADEIAPPGVMAEIFAAKGEDRVELDWEPTRLVSPVLEERFTWLEEFLGKWGIESGEPRMEDDAVTASSGDCDRVELEVAESVDDPVCR
jgi:hypothetical protein